MKKINLGLLVFADRRESDFTSELFTRAVLTTLVSSLVACGSGNTEPKKETNQQRINSAKITSCQYKFNEIGVSAPSTLPSEKMISTSFGKRFDENILESIMDTDGEQTTTFARLTNLHFYKVNAADEGACGYTESLPLATSIWQGVFERQATDEDGNVNGVAGIYFPPDYVERYEGANPGNKSVILVKRTSNRYVLVHEFMHHIFQLAGIARTTDIIHSAEAAAERFDDLKKKFKNDRSAEVYREVTAALLEWRLAINDVLKEFYLEEMTIESVLADKYLSGRLRGVHELARLNGDFYIESSAEKAVEEITRLDKEDAFLSSLENTVAVPDQSLMGEARANLARSKTARNSVLIELQQLLRKAEKRIGDFNATNKGGYRINRSGIIDDEGKAHPHVGCSHSREADEFFARRRR